MDGGDYCTDYARSSRVPASTGPSMIAFVAPGGDAITWSSPEGNGSNAPIVAVLPQNGSGTRSIHRPPRGQPGRRRMGQPDRARPSPLNGSTSPDPQRG
jgi:hypothetical protein